MVLCFIIIQFKIFYNFFDDFITKEMRRAFYNFSEFPRCHVVIDFQFKSVMFRKKYAFSPFKCI